MPADVNVTERVARAKAASHDRPVYTIDYDDARTMLSALADPEVQAGIAQVHHDFHHPRTCRGGCAGVDEVDEEFAAAVVERLMGRAL